MAANGLAKSELVYRALRERILSGEYTPGYRLVLGQIAKDMNVSTVPVREAVRRLEAEKLVLFTANVGAQVASVDIDQYSNVMELLAYLEGAATALAAPHLTEGELTHAQEVNEEMRRLAGPSFDPSRFTALNREFHEALFSACPNEYLMERVRHEWEVVKMVRRTDFAFAPENAVLSVNEHAHILDLVRAKAPSEEIAKAARDHKLRTRRVFVEARRAS